MQPRNSRPGTVFSVVWNKNPQKDTLYVCIARPSSTCASHIYALIMDGWSDLYRQLVPTSSDPDQGNTKARRPRKLVVSRLTAGQFYNACPSSNPEGTKIVFSSSRSHNDDDDDVRGGGKKKNLYIMEDSEVGEHGEEGMVTRLTCGEWTDTHCQWSPRGDWIVFSSTRDDNPSYHFGIFLVMASNPDVVVRVVGGGAYYVNRPVFSCDATSIAFTSDLAAVSCEPISMPKFVHAAKPCGDIFFVDIDPDDIHRNRDIKSIRRVTHSRFDYSTNSWSMWATRNDYADPNSQWNMMVTLGPHEEPYKPTCPYVYTDGGESWHMTGNLVIPP